jgi:type IV pilus assembly protein PilZ
MRSIYQVSSISMTEAEHQEGTRPSQVPREDRAPITLRVDYKRLNTFFADYTKNISKGGTFIHTTKPLDVGTEFTFVLSLPETIQLELKGIVKWVVPESVASAENPAGMGIQFVFADDSQRLAVENVVAGMMNEALGPVLAQKLLGRDRDPQS